VCDRQRASDVAHRFTGILSLVAPVSASHFRLQYLYGVNAAREMAQQRGLLKKLHAGSGAADVRAYLQDQAESCAQIGTNLWRTAAFRSLGQSDWYCEGGFDFA
jgi:hypothetical protein